MATSTKPAGRVVLRGGASLVKRRPVFSADSRYIFVCSGHVIRVFSVASGECVTELWGHKDAVTGVSVNPIIKLQLFSSSLDGTIRQWDYADGVLLKTFCIGPPLHGLLVHPNLKNKLYVIIQQKFGKNWKDEEGNLAVVHLPRNAPGMVVDVDSQVVLTRINARDKCAAIGKDGEYVAGISGSQLKVVFTANNHGQGSETVSLSDAKRTVLTCVSCHPTEYTIATGNYKGHLILWRNFHKTNVITSIEHWHNLRVEDVCFSTEGSNLFSVGHECTLVTWQTNTKHRDFLPRLGAPISHVTCSPDNQYKAMCLTNNAILVVKVNKIVHKIQGLSFGDYTKPSKDRIPTGLTTDPRTKALVLNGNPGHLQFYQLQQDKLLYNLDIVGENYISPESLHKPLVNTEVTRIAFDIAGNWLATIERRDDGETAVEMRLKFWQWDEQKQSFKLNTSIESPHEGNVNTLYLRGAVKNSEPMAITTAEDKKFKLWRLLDDAEMNSKNKSWNCVFVGAYRDMQPKDASFSEDGSLVAVAFSQIITIWDPEANELKKTLCHGKHTDPIRFLKFGRGSSSCHLVSVNYSNISVWNLITCDVLWNVNLQVNLFIADPLSGLFAVFDKTSNLFVFNTTEPRVIYAQKSIMRDHIQMAIFAPLLKRKTSTGPNQTNDPGRLPWEHVSQMYFMTAKQDLFTLVSEQRDKEECDEYKSSENMTLHSDILPTPFAMLLGSQPASMKDDEETGLDTIRIQGALGTASVKQMLSSPAHVLPPAKVLCRSFLNTLLPSIKDGEDTRHADSDSEVDENMDASDKSDDEDDGQKTKLSQTEEETLNSKGQNPENEEEIQWSEADVHKLEKAARKGFKWMKPVFKDVLS